MPNPTATGEELVSNSALLPRSLFKGEVKPGDIVTLTVSAIYGDEVEAAVSAAPAMEPPENVEPPTMTADEEIDQAAETV
jgi:hypothetical protein